MERAFILDTTIQLRSVAQTTGIHYMYCNFLGLVVHLLVRCVLRA